LTNIKYIVYIVIY